MARYLSEEWRAEIEKRLREQLSPEEMDHITTSVNNRYSNCPGGRQKYFFMSSVDGVIDKVLVGEGDGPEAEFCISGDYDIFARIARAELDLQKALMNGMLKFKGNVIRAFRLARLNDRINDIIAAVDAAY